jgi:hypothetical protein
MDGSIPPEAAIRRSNAARLAAAAVVVVLAAAYLFRLGRAPMFLGGDEAQFAVHAQSIATTGRDLNGTTLPAFVNITDPLQPATHSGIWYQPLLFYLIAIALRFSAFAEGTIRLPAVAMAVLDGALAFLVARRLTRTEWGGAAATAMIMLSPSHFIFGRQALDYICPLPFVLGWLWCLSAYVDGGRRGWLAAAGAVLGVGVYSYIASWMTMSLLLVASAAVVWRTGRAEREGVTALCAGFAVPLLWSAVAVLARPAILSDTIARYGLAAGGGALSPSGLIERAGLYWEYVDPSYLFFSGGSNPTQSTREAGVFLLPVAVFFVAGVRELWRARSIIGRLALFGFAIAPLPIVLTLPQSAHGAAGRDLVAVPFGVLVASAGVAVMIANGRRVSQLIAIALLAAMPIQFAFFARGYFTTYQKSAAVRFDPANFDAIADVIVAADTSQSAPYIYLSQALDDASVRWRFQTLKRRREDLWSRSRAVSREAVASLDVPAGSLLVMTPAEQVSDSRWAIVTTVNDPAAMPSAVLLRRTR